MIIFYYKKWYSNSEELASARNPYNWSKARFEDAENILSGQTPQEDYRTLKTNLKNMGFSVPVLYRRYTDITEYWGSQFIDFSVDSSFANSVDGLIILDFEKMKKEKRERYYNSKSFSSFNEKYA